MNEEGREVFERGFFLVISWIVFFFVGLGVGIYTKNNSANNVEELIKVDSLVKVNDSIKIKVEKLDSIKNAKVIEVQTLDNDSTLKLFYELVSE